MRRDHAAAQDQVDARPRDERRQLLEGLTVRHVAVVAFVDFP
jgi:hypothetical protein